MVKKKALEYGAYLEGVEDRVINQLELLDFRVQSFQMLPCAVSPVLKIDIKIDQLVGELLDVQCYFL
jgi:hypothetical protein